MTAYRLIRAESEQVAALALQKREWRFVNVASA